MSCLYILFISDGLVSDKKTVIKEKLLVDANLAPMMSQPPRQYSKTGFINPEPYHDEGELPNILILIVGVSKRVHVGSSHLVVSSQTVNLNLCACCPKREVSEWDPLLCIHLVVYPGGAETSNMEQVLIFLCYGMSEHTFGIFTNFLKYILIP